MKSNALLYFFHLCQACLCIFNNKNPQSYIFGNYKDLKNLKHQNVKIKKPQTEGRGSAHHSQFLGNRRDISESLGKK